jgi:hypothetical protein
MQNSPFTALMKNERMVMKTYLMEQAGKDVVA